MSSKKGTAARLNSPFLQQRDEGEKRRYSAVRNASDAHDSPGHSDRLGPIDPALLPPQWYQAASLLPYTPQRPHDDDAELHHLLAPVREWLGGSSEHSPQSTPARHSSHSPPPPPPPAMRSFGLFKPRIARRIATIVYRTNWRDWERARDRLHPSGGL